MFVSTYITFSFKDIDKLLLKLNSILGAVLIELISLKIVAITIYNSL
jgi:hypothetical protein